MKLTHGNRTRRTTGDQMAAEFQAAHFCEQPGRNEPTRGEIERRAYEIYLARNGAPGNADVDWLQAETELRGHKSGTGPG